MNSVRSKATSQVWNIEDFMPGKEKERELEMVCGTDEEIYAQLMKYMPPQVQ